MLTCVVLRGFDIACTVVDFDAAGASRKIRGRGCGAICACDDRA